MIERYDVAIVGGGPVGLLLACSLALRGLSLAVFEQRPERSRHSRAVGIHPPGLACLAEVGAAPALLARGVRVQSAFAFGHERPLGRVSFAHLPGPYPFVLCVPQCETERVLEARVHALAKGALKRGHEVLACHAGPRAVTLDVCAAGRVQSVDARFVVGCDGPRSVVRSAAGIAYRGGPYREHFVMADTADETPFGSDAAVFLTRGGVVESFPLPGGLRRWVVGLHAPTAATSARRVEQLVRERTGQCAPAETASMVSAFTAEHYLADRFARGSLLLAGDAAHVISPIGGQGMNLGWLDAALLAGLLAEAVRTPPRADALFRRYERTRRHAAAVATRRAELFMGIGQRQHLWGLRDLVLERLLSSSLADNMAQVFAMRGLTSNVPTLEA